MTNPLNFDASGIKPANRERLLNAYRYYMGKSGIDGAENATPPQVVAWLQNQIWSGIKANVKAYEEEVAAIEAKNAVTLMDD